ncbi:hypothetical protein DC094_14620 [Pelagibaculum spongiae]|uniref:Uncharacterized protein n=1 Tax=Pelagibaculum spongiae TaxID=2080658 RepID=A0A2V1GRF7_9GAMM|nr:hypothetical protein DC094_14620 [Pelagibaculum spongiae]
MSRFTLKKSAVAFVATCLLTITACDGIYPTPQDGALSFSIQDEDLAIGRIAGDLTISPSLDESDITEYNLYWGTDDCIKVDPEPIARIAATGGNVFHRFYPAANASQIRVGADKLLVFSGNDDAEMATCIDMEIVDAGASPLTIQSGSVLITDADQRPRSLGGQLAVIASSSEAMIDGYRLYWGVSETQKLPNAESFAGGIKNNGFIYSLGSNTNNTATIIPERVTHILSYTYLGTQENTIPRYLSIIESASPVSAPQNVTFTDTDPDGGQIAGNLAITPAADLSFLPPTHYDIFWGKTNQIRLSLIESIPADTVPLQYTFPVDTPVVPDARFLFVIPRNAGGLAASFRDFVVTISDIGLPILDAAAISFTDTDPNAGKLSGTVTIAAAPDETNITHYVLYWADAAGDRLYDLPIISLEANNRNNLTFRIPNNTIKPAFASKLAVYTKNSGGEKITGIAVSINDL